MEQIYIQNIKINKVRHLENINLSVGNSGRKHIILTGKNGSGKTSVLDAMATFINSVTMGRNPEQLMQDIDGTESLLESWIRMGEKIQQRQAEENLQYEKNLKRDGLLLLIIRQIEYFHRLNRSMWKRFSLNQSMRLMKLREVNLLSTYWI